MIWVTDARHTSDYKVFVRFSDGKEAEIDLKNHIASKQNGTVFEPLKNPEQFQKLYFNPDTDTIEWPCGADIAPERLYEMAVA
jgi:hypothetical protein